MKARILNSTCVVLIACSAFASQDSIGPNGINSAVLNLNGSGVPIGQVEILRPAKPGLDSPGFVNDDVVPTAVFIQANPANMDVGVDIFDPHATEIASIMISDHTTATGVAPNASLYASASLPDTRIERAFVAMQHVALQAGGDVRAINLSFGAGPVNDPLDGNNPLTLFMDWSARRHDVLYVIAGPETGFAAGIDWGVDNYNGMTVAYSTFVNGVYRQVAAGNIQRIVDQGDRTFVSLIAPGDAVQVASQGNTTRIRDGTSVAAPHVTGTVALLQQFANQQIMNVGAPRWKSSPGAGQAAPAQRHEVMKAVLMNSADKLIDNGTVTLPGEVHCRLVAFLEWSER